MDFVENDDAVNGRRADYGGRKQRERIDDSFHNNSDMRSAIRWECRSIVSENARFWQAAKRRGSRIPPCGGGGAVKFLIPPKRRWSLP
jgi:hypothetical protein